MAHDRYIKPTNKIGQQRQQIKVDYYLNEWMTIMVKNLMTISFHVIYSAIEKLRALAITDAIESCHNCTQTRECN